MIFYHDLKNKKIAEIHLFYFNCCFYCVLKVGHFKSISLAFFEFFDDIFFKVFWVIPFFLVLTLYVLPLNIVVTVYFLGISVILIFTIPFLSVLTVDVLPLIINMTDSPLSATLPSLETTLR